MRFLRWLVAMLWLMMRARRRLVPVRVAVHVR